jgi:FkbM family methyltransferase
LATLIRNFVKWAFAGGVAKRFARTRLGQDLFFLLSQNYTDVVMSRRQGITYFVLTTDRTIGRSVFLDGAFDSGEIEGIFKTLDQLGINNFNTKTFLDIGANIGTTSLPAVMRYGFSSAIALEPEPTNFRLLQQNILANGLNDRIQAVNCALTDRPQELLFEICSANSGDNRVRIAGNGRASGVMDEEQRRTIHVQGSTFDALVEDGTIRLADLGLVWIDTQGHEAHVLQGASKLLASHLPVVMEYWPYALNRVDGLQTLEDLIMSNYTRFLDLRKQAHAAAPRLLPISEFKDMRNVGMTDVLLLKD